MTPREAILLLGPTGSGKTPLGEQLQRRGLGGRACRHFDFGQRLREIVSGARPPRGLSPGDVDGLRAVLEGGALLTDEQFPVGGRVLRAFLAGCPPDALIVLNGLPRHPGQARDVERIVRVCTVVVLDCPGEVALRRIRTNAGGDRAGRTDDDEASVGAKLDTYARRTGALADHYRARGVPVRGLPVGPDTSADDLWRALSAAL